MTMAIRTSVALIVVMCSVTLAAAGNGSLKVTSFPSGAEVWVDGVNTGKVTPMSVSLSEGDHIISVRLPGTGWNPDTRTVTIVAGNNDLSVTLLPTVTVGPPGPAGPGGAPAAVRPAGPAECATAGIVVTSGDGKTSVPVCNGARGQEGPQGIQGIQGVQGNQGVQGEPGPAGAPASVRMATSMECPTGGIVVISGNGEASLPVCNGSQGPQGPQGTQGTQGIQGAQGLPGSPGPPGPPGGAPAVDPSTLVGFADNLLVDIGSGFKAFGVSPVYIEVDALMDASGRGLITYSPGKIHVAPFVIASRRGVDDAGQPLPDSGPELAEWFALTMEDHAAGGRTVHITLRGTDGADNLTVEFEGCAPTTLDTDFAGAVRVLVRCLRANSFAVAGAEVDASAFDSPYLPDQVTSHDLFLDMGGLQYISDVSGGGKRLVSVDVRPELEIDPLRLRAGSADASGGFRVDGIRDWIAATLARDLSRMFSGVALVDANGFAVAQYSNMFLIHIGLIDPARTVQISFPTRFGPLTFIRIGFDLIMREGRPPL